MGKFKKNSSLQCSKFTSSEQAEVVFDDQSSVIGTISPKKVTSIQKSTKEKKSELKKSRQKWTEIEVLNYYLFYLKFITEYPFFQITWGGWKPEKIYIKMAQFISEQSDGHRKTQQQCKSFDERIKKMYFSQSDIPDVCVLKVKEELSKNDNHVAKQILEDYQRCVSTPSRHMTLCWRELDRLNEGMKKIQMFYDEVIQKPKRQLLQETHATQLWKTQTFGDDFSEECIG